MQNFFELNNNDIINKYQNIVTELINENFINIEDNINYPSSSKFFINYLFSHNINENIIYNKISKEFDIELFDIDKLEIQDVILTDIGIQVKDVFYFVNPFFNVNKKINESNKSLLIFNKNGIIKSKDYEYIKEALKKESINNEGSDYFLNNIIYKAINKNCFKLIINIEKEKSSSIYYNFNNNVYRIEEVYKYKDVPDISGVRNFNGRDYYIDIEKVENSDKNNVIYFINVSDFNNVNKIVDIDSKYGEKIEEMLGYSNGLFILSQKNDYGLYYSFLKNIAESKNKKIFSYEEKITTKISNVFQTNDLENSIKNINLFDVIFIKDIKNNNHVNFIKQALQLGKLVIVSTISQDSLLALSSFISNFDLDKNLLAEKLIGVYHTTLLPKVCQVCSEKYPIRQSNIIKEDKFKSYQMGIKPETIIRKVNHKGCSNCNHGYEKGVYISELLDNDKDVSKQIENVFNIRELRNLKQSKRWDTIYLYARLLVEKNIITIEDVKNIL
mgnify:FL=1|tara:strand:+ start:2237 stop:3739 length:1503 start_codon:yes stop_codon:yes gene_type:complete